MQSKRVRAANVANYANREASTTIKTRLKWSANGETVAWVCQKVFDRFKWQQGEITMSNAEFSAYQEMLRGCEESLFSQQVGDDDEIIEDEQE